MSDADHDIATRLIQAEQRISYWEAMHRVHVENHLAEHERDREELEKAAKEATRVEPRVRALEDWRIEALVTTRTLLRIMQLTFGASLLAAVGAILSLVDLVMRQR